jgi:hypothetical protein
VEEPGVTGPTSGGGPKNWNAAAYEKVRIIPVIRCDQPSNQI